jgi:Protein of unknown function (DUF3618)
VTEPTSPNSTPPSAPGPAPSRRELEDDVTRTRAELGATIDALTTRLSPSYQAAHVARSTRQAASDAGAYLTGNGLPDGDARRARNAKVLLGVVVIGAAALVAIAVRAARR